MASYEAHINTKFGKLIVHFTDRSDLTIKLEEAALLIQTIETKTAEFAVIKESEVMGLEGICTITPSGLPRILVYPKTDSDKVRLALYASKGPLSSEEITTVTGVRNPTALRFMKFDEVNRSGDKFILSGRGRTVVATKVLPNLRPKQES